MSGNISIVEMARMVGLSRARFYQLVGTTFPHPIYDVASRRPFYNEELQQVCLDVRKRNCGIDGKPLLFYSRRLSTTPRKLTKRSPSKSPNKHLVAGLTALGLDATAKQVESAIATLYPDGVVICLKVMYCERCFCTSGVRIRAIMWGDSIHYQPS